uniref:FBA_2 domain-containing protein n=1 Tax=Caenorhabditis tropicalis TaxID=1561998 RepID=A0A1I7TH83_9PELO
MEQASENLDNLEEEVFPLLKLPSIGMENALSIMTPLELIELSSLSVRSKTTVKNFFRIKPKFETHLNIIDGAHIRISKNYQDWFLKKINKPGIEEERRFMNNEMNELTKAFEYIKEVLGCDFKSVRIDLDKSPTENRRLIDWLRSQQPSFDTIAVEGNYLNYDDDVKYLMENLKVTGEFIPVKLRHADDFRLEIPNNLRVLQVEHSGFIKFEQFMKLDCEQIVFFQSPLTSQEIHRFLKSWMACESHLNLKALQVSIVHPDVIDAVNGVPHEEVEIDDNIQEICLLPPTNKRLQYHKIRWEDCYGLCIAIKG